MPTAKYPKDQQESAKRKGPAAEFRDSNLSVTIWPNTSNDGITRHNVILTRSYNAGGKWTKTSSLGKLDLQRAIKLLDRADDWIFNTSAKARIEDAQAIPS